MYRKLIMNHLVRRMVSSSSTPPPRQWSLLPLASAAVAATAAASLSLSVETLSTTTCEEQQSPPPPPHYHSEQEQHPSVAPGLHGRHEGSKENENEKDDNNDEEEEEAPQCILCLTFRSGPCRPFFIPYEKCLKANPSPESSDNHEDDNGHVKDKNANDGDPNVSTTPVNDDATSTTTDNNNDDDPANACLDEVMPFLECLSQYSNMHMLLFLQSYQQLYIDPFETHLKEIQKVTPLPWTGVDMDWSDVWTYANDNNLTLADFSATPSVDWNEFLSSGKYYYQQDDNDSTTGSSTTTATIKDLDDCASDPTCPARDIILGKSVHDEPIYNPQTFTEDIKTLIPVGVRVNLYDDAGTTGDEDDKGAAGTGTGRYRLHSCYARDQNGRLLGHNENLESLLADGGTNEYLLKLVIHPGDTMCIKLYKIYVRDENEEEDQEVRLYVSKSKFLVEAAYEAGFK